jgi:hypothetical protein
MAFDFPYEQQKLPNRQDPFAILCRILARAHKPTVRRASRNREKTNDVHDAPQMLFGNWLALAYMRVSAQTPLLSSAIIPLSSASKDYLSTSADQVNNLLLEPPVIFQRGLKRETM